jgi:prepilin-type N-terminal cleavage/methylation domain-containing protein
MLRRLRREEGFGLIEMMIALTILAIATTSLVSVFIAGHLTLRRASQADSATVLADKLLERFRAEQFDDIGLSSGLLAGVDSTYANDPNDPNGSVLGTQLPGFGNITDANWHDAANSNASASSCAGISSDGPTVSVTCVPSRVIPDVNRPSEKAPDGRSYRIDTYVTWACANPATETLSGSTDSPSCSGVALAQVKVVTIVVRDDSSAAALAGAPLYRSATVFDRLGGSVTCSGLPCGGGIPTATVTPTGTQSTSTIQTTTGSAPAAPAGIVLANGGGTGNTYIDLGNVTSLNIDVSLGSTSLASDTVTLTVSDGSTNCGGSAAATPGAGIVHFLNLNCQALADGTINVIAVASNTNGSSSGIGIQPIKDTSTPAAPTSITLTNGQGQASNYINNSTKAAVGLSVTLGSTSKSTDTVSVKVSDGTNSTNTATANGVAGGGTVAMPSINASSINDGSVTASATVTNAAGNTSPAATLGIGKDTVAPTATITRAGASPVSSGPVTWTVTFNDTVYNVAAGNFALVKVGLGGTPAITSVSGSGTTWSVTASATCCGTLGLNLTTAGSLQDKAGNAITSLPVTGAVYTVDTSPTITALQLVNVSGNIAGKVEKGDQIKVTFSKALDTTTFCSGWDGTTALSGNGQVVVTVTDGTGATNDKLTVTTASGCTFNFGTVDLGSTAYISAGNASFSGNGGNASTIAWSSGTNTLTITLGTKSGSGVVAVVALSTAVYTPSAAIQDPYGTAVSGTGSTGLRQNF